MSSGSAVSGLLNGEKENVHVYGNKKGNESGAAGSTDSSSLIVLAAAAAGDNSNDTAIVTVTSGVVVAAGTTVPSGTTSNNDRGGARFGGNGNGDSDSNSNSGVCVTGLIAGGVVGVEFCDVRPSDPGNYEELRGRRDVNSRLDYGETEFQQAYPGTCIEEAPIVDLTAATTTIIASGTTTATDTTTTTTTTATSIGIIERDDRTTTVPALYYEEDEEEDNNEEEDDNMVAAMNEHLSNASTTSGGGGGGGGVRNNAVSSTVAGANSVVGQGNNSCNEFENVDEDGKPAAGILSFPCDFDHMYASMTDGGAPAVATATSTLGVSPLRGNEPRQNDLTEVKHLKELLLLHLDLIQQQSEQIVTKDKLLAALRQENETLKLRLERMDRRVNLQKLRSENNESSVASEHIGACSPSTVNAVNVPSTSELNRNIQSENNNSQYNESFKIRLNTSGGITTVKQEPNDNQSKHEAKVDAGNDIRLEWEEKKKRRTDPVPLSSGSKRKRGVSCSSTISNDASTLIQDKTLTQEGSRKSDRKGKPLTKKEFFLSTEEHYYTAVGDPNYTLSLKEPCPIESDASLEVPNWRVKIYTSCYTMEGTENLDDEIFNKRHLKLENDERRRKRWDVQRIREQRHIEKLKQRQERQNHQATCYNTNHTGPCPSTVEEEQISSLWPDAEQIQSLQVDPQLPVTAFGAPIPSFTPSEFSLPWSNTSRSNSRRPKRSTGRRKSTRR